MADITITPASVTFSATGLAYRIQGIAGAAVAIGELVYKDTADSNKIKLADANSATAIARVPIGLICAAASAAGQPCEYTTFDDNLTIGTHGVSVNGALILSATSGKLAPIADITTGWYGTIVAITRSSTAIVFNCINPLSSTVAT